MSIEIGKAGLFQKYDKDADGKLNKEELLGLLTEMTDGEAPSEEFLNQFVFIVIILFKGFY